MSDTQQREAAMRFSEYWKGKDYGKGGNKMDSDSVKDSCFKNDTGRFYCDESGMITFFQSDEKNKLHQPPHGFGNEQYMKNLVIPNGVKRIGFFDDNDYKMDVSSVTFRGIHVVGKVRFPETLISLGAGTFSDCLMMDLELTASLVEIGAGVMMGCYIHKLRIPENMPIPYTQELFCVGRQFKETIIDTLIVPQNYPYKGLMPEALIENIVFY